MVYKIYLMCVVGLLKPNHFQLSASPTVNIGGTPISFTDKIKYLGVCLNADLKDDDDLHRQTRMLYGIGNKLKSCFSKCSSKVKNILFQSHCVSFYACQLWCRYKQSSYHRLRVAFNDAYRLVHHIPRWISVRENMVSNDITTFEAVLRKSMYSFVQRCYNSSNSWINRLINSDVFHKSQYLCHYAQSLLNA